jgi:hypothetical protein
MMRASLCVALITLTAACSEAPETEPAVERSSVASPRTFGAYCQEDYQNAWQEPLPSTWDMCGRFVNDLDDTDSKAFYFNAHGAKTFFEETGDALSGGLDTVDLVFYAGHGGAFTASESANACGVSGIAGVLAMWDVNKFACTSNTRLGDDSRGLSILSTYTCETHAGGSHSVTTPGQIPGTLYVDRWVKAFRGGLRMSTSSVELTSFGSTFVDIGKRYSDNLQAGQSFSSAWANALNVGSTNDPSLVTSGSSSDDCISRLDNMTWQNHTTFPRLRDAAVAKMCRRYWENI